MCLFCDSSFVFERHIARLDDDERVSARLGSARLAPLSSHRLASPRLAMSRRRVIDLTSATVGRARVASSTSRASGASRPRALDGFRNVAPREPSTSARALPRAPSARGFAAEASEAATPHPDPTSSTVFPRTTEGLSRMYRATPCPPTQGTAQYGGWRLYVAVSYTHLRAHETGA